MVRRACQLALRMPRVTEVEQVNDDHIEEPVRHKRADAVHVAPQERCGAKPPSAKVALCNQRQRSELSAAHASSPKVSSSHSRPPCLMTVTRGSSKQTRSPWSVQLLRLGKWRREVSIT